MINITHVRSDDRYIHGQVATGWIPHTGTNLVIICNDDVAQDELRQQLIAIAAPNGCGVRFFSVQKTIDVIHKASPAQKILILTENPTDVLRLVEGGVPITQLNLGNRGFSQENNIAAFKSYYVNEQEKVSLQRLISKGVNVYYALTPNDIKENFKG